MQRHLMLRCRKQGAGYLACCTTKSFDGLKLIAEEDQLIHLTQS